MELTDKQRLENRIANRTKQITQIRQKLLSAHTKDPASTADLNASYNRLLAELNTARTDLDELRSRTPTGGKRKRTYKKRAKKTKKRTSRRR
jgi:hypothetical protein